MEKQKTLIFLLSVMLFLAASFIVYSWNEPTTPMPSGYTAPLNTSATAQNKVGELGAASFVDADDSDYYINPSGDSIISGKIVAEGEILDGDSSNTVVTKGYVGNIINTNNGSQVLYLVGKSRACPDGYISLERRWSTRVCANKTSCTTVEG